MTLMKTLRCNNCGKVERLAEVKRMRGRPRRFEQLEGFAGWVGISLHMSDGERMVSRAHLCLHCFAEVSELWGLGPECWVPYGKGVW
jgi:hypothetical protein